MTVKKIAIVTGGNRGIGHEIARQLMKSDLLVVVGARDRARCDIALESLGKEGSNVAAFPLDVNDTKSVRRFVEHVQRHDRVWLCRGVDIARHWHETHPFEG